MATKEKATDNNTSATTDGNFTIKPAASIELPAVLDYAESYENATTQPEAFRLNAEQTERITDALAKGEDKAESLAEFIKYAWEMAGIQTIDEFTFFMFSIGRRAGMQELVDNPLKVLMMAREGML